MQSCCDNFIVLENSLHHFSISDIAAGLSVQGGDWTLNLGLWTITLDFPCHIIVCPWALCHHSHAGCLSALADLTVYFTLPVDSQLFTSGQLYHTCVQTRLWVVKRHEPWISALYKCNVTLHYILSQKDHNLTHAQTLLHFGSRVSVEQTVCAPALPTRLYLVRDVGSALAWNARSPVFDPGPGQ